jgi:hypothetical protein
MVIERDEMVKERYDMVIERDERVKEREKRKRNKRLIEIEIY